MPVGVGGKQAVSRQQGLVRAAINILAVGAAGRPKHEAVGLAPVEIMICLLYENMEVYSFTNGELWDML